MTEIIIQKILVGILQTVEMTFFASLFAYIVGLPLGILLYATAKGRILENRAVNFVIGLFAVKLRAGAGHFSVDVRVEDDVLRQGR